ncbi:Acyl-CoA_synthetase [Hexamita inflata]|uniref:Acyl-CoA synthetase n=1 Tax=Hexamita inflata TaxID=28002 RepID=A0AA86R0W6_9EUKA|nr:Acyl-CoA synthetase [Hexamita inflata]
MQFHEISAEKPCAALESIMKTAAARSDRYLYEYECYELFQTVGINIPTYRYFPLSEVSQISAWMQDSKKYVFKCQIPGVLHKTDIGGVKLFVTKESAAVDAEQFIAKLKSHQLEGILVVEMAQFHTKTPSHGEILLSALIDPAFGPVVCFGLGGTTVEQMKEFMPESLLFIPAFVNLETSKEWRTRIEQLPISQYLLGKIRGIDKQVNSLNDIIQPIAALQKLIINNLTNAHFIEELEINPCVVDKASGKIIALDGVVKIGSNSCSQQFLANQCKRSMKPLYKTGLFVAPKSVLLAGVSSKVLTNPCTVVLQKFLEMNSQQEVKTQLFCIHPQAEELFGVKCYKSLAELKKHVPSIDLFVCGVAAVAAHEMLVEIIETGFCKSSFILSAGFGETEKGKELEKDLREKLNQAVQKVQIQGDKVVENVHYPLLNGANTLGYLWKDLINTVFVSSKKSSSTDAQNKLIETKNSNIALLCQSGACMITRLSDLAGKCSPMFSMSVGNQIDMSNVDFFEWLLQEDSFEQFIQKEHADPAMYQQLKKIDQDKATLKVFAFYIEGLNPTDGQRLIRLTQKARSQGKIVIIYKTGRTKQGAHAAAGHTASLSGSYDMFKQLLSTSGAVLVDQLDEFEDTVYVASAFTQKKIEFDKKFKVGILTNAGFEKCCYADHLFLKEGSSNYMELPDFEETKQQLISIFDKYKLSSVIDLDQILDTTPTIPDLGYYEFAKVLVQSPEISAVLVSPVPETHMIATVTGDCGTIAGRDFMTEPGSIGHLMVKLAKECEKPLIVTIESGWKFEPLRKFLADAGIIVFDKADKAARAINNVVRGLVGWTGK